MDRETVKAEEQVYFDEAYDCREKMRSRLRSFPDAAAHAEAAQKLHEYADHARRAIRGPGSPVAFGRMDTEESETWYVGYHAIWDSQNDIKVVNWQAPVATPYYEANVDDARGLVLRRDFSTEGNRILDFEDLVYAELALDVDQLLAPRVGPGAISDALLEDLERHRTGEMQDIVRTIQQAQYRLVREDLDRLLVIQGGPGTGKTAVALHRVSWLLFNYRDRIGPSDVMVVGPNPTFIRYIQKVLPGLGDESVRQSALTGLVTDVRFGQSEPTDLATLKGDLRMQSLIDRGLQDRISIPSDQLQVEVGTVMVTLGSKQLQPRVDRLRALRYSAGRQRLREFVREEVVRQAGRAPERDGQIDSLLDRIWPSLTPQAFLRELYGSERRLVTAAAEDFTAAEVRALYRRAEEKLSEEVWTQTDAAVLDYANYAMNGLPARRYEHIVVDEAQDLSPMELAMIARRSKTGSMTVLGDVAQSIGGWARDSWTDVIEALAGDVKTDLQELEIGYRVPRQIFEFAAQLLPHIAPTVTPPRIVREGISDPTLVSASAGEVPNRTVDAAAEYAGRGLPVGVIVPEELRSGVEAAFSRKGVNWSDARSHGLGGPIILVSPLDCRGLEFDAVVVVEPEAIVREQAMGHRLLYVALTRATQFLTVVHAGMALPFPPGDSVMPTTATASPPPDGPSRADVSIHPREERALEAFVSVLADEIKESLQPDLWAAAARRLRELLEGNGAEDPGSDSG